MIVAETGEYCVAIMGIRIFFVQHLPQIADFGIGGWVQDHSGKLPEKMDVIPKQAKVEFF